MVLTWFRISTRFASFSEITKLNRSTFREMNRNIKNMPRTNKLKITYPNHVVNVEQVHLESIPFSALERIASMLQLLCECLRLWAWRIYYCLCATLRSHSSVQIEWIISFTKMFISLLWIIMNYYEWK